MKKQILFLVLCCICYITVSAAVGNRLANGNMESQGAWQISYLNTPATQNPVAEWGYTADKPTAGVGGGLHVTGTSTAGNSQYCIYQAVTLSADSVYNFDAAFKNISLQQAWCEAYIGSIPVEGTDYTDPQSGTKIANYGSWDNPAAAAEGTFKLNATCKQFVPPTTGVYYFILKMGTTTWDATVPKFEIIVDELTLTSARIAPISAFHADVRSGFAPLNVKFADDSKYATSWSWDFGDGSSSTDQNPSHTFATVGNYTVTLTTTNEIGNNVKTSANFINVTPLVPLTGGGLIKGGNMESADYWTVDYLNTGADFYPVATWNYTEKVPNAGKGGCLYVTAPAGAAGIQYAIYQKVHLSIDSVYVFDGAFRDFSTNLKSFWTEVYIGPKPAGGGADYGTADGTLIAKFDAWNAGSPVAGLNGTFKIHSSPYSTYTPTETGDYYLIVKMGTWDGAGYQIALDELSLTQTRTKPAVSFTATNAVGFPSLTAKFVNTTKFANSYLWDFGDGSATSTEEQPEHTYTAIGTYNVTLKATNEIGDSVLVSTGLIKVNDRPALPAGEMLYGGNMENGNFWYTSKLNAADATTLTWNYTDAIPTGGAGGSLRIQSDGGNFNKAIFQEVQLKKGYSYVFDGLFKDIKGIADYWCEGYIGTVMPVDGTDYTATQGTQLFAINTWNGSPKFIDGHLQSATTVTSFKAPTSGTYYFVFKMGSNKADGSNEILIDNLTLKEVLPVKADFYAETTSGTAPIAIQFYDLSTNATSWSWDFGDGGTSTDQDPIHTYTNGGTFTVKLISSNSGSTDTLISTGLITITGPNSIPTIDYTKYRISTTNHMINIDGVQNNVKLFDVSGRLIQSMNVVGKFRSQSLNSGLYIVHVDDCATKISVK
ncbi:MAG: PKD domain-containing protein [Bacteroidota bacterium]|nr:PKD domain-containing protein [Bacteroidota bacterium]